MPTANSSIRERALFPVAVAASGLISIAIGYIAVISSSAGTILVTRFIAGAGNPFSGLFIALVLLGAALPAGAVIYTLRSGYPVDKFSKAGSRHWNLFFAIGVTTGGLTMAGWFLAPHINTPAPIRTMVPLTPHQREAYALPFLVVLPMYLAIMYPTVDSVENSPPKSNSLKRSIVLRVRDHRYSPWSSSDSIREAKPRDMDAQSRSTKKRTHTVTKSASKEDEKSETAEDETQKSNDESGTDLSFGGWQMPADADVSFADVGGYDDTKGQMQKKLIRPLQESSDRYEKLGLTPPNVLLYGPPGTGKSFLAKAVIGELSVPYNITSGGKITSKNLNESSTRITELFDDARQLAERHGATMIFIDEIDAVLPDRRGDNQHQEDKKVVDEFLNHLDDCGEDNIVVIGATNYLDELDDAAIRSGRMDEKIEMPLPDVDARKAILRKQLEQRGAADFPESEITAAAYEIDGKSAADIKKIVKDAAYEALERGDDMIAIEDLQKAVEAEVG